MIDRLHACLDPDLRVVLGEMQPLRYTEAPPAEEGVPPYVRAASAIRRNAHSARRLIVQDDTNALAWLDPDGRVEFSLLPAGEDGRRVFQESLGNKHAKLDLEACVVLPDGRFAVFGSGSTSVRERLVIVDSDQRVQVRKASDLYHRFREVIEFSGSELNIEGAIVVGDRLRFFQRGNGAARGALVPVNAIGDLELEAFLAWLDRRGPAPSFVRVAQVDLGGAGQAAYGFTDATVLSDGRVAFLACAEDSADVVADGPLCGCRFGLIGGNSVQVANILDEQGSPVMMKLEGIEARLDEPLAFDVVSDMDSPDQPARFGTLRVVEGGR